MRKEWESVRTLNTKLDSWPDFKWIEVMDQFQNILDLPAWDESGFVSIFSKQTNFVNFLMAEHMPLSAHLATELYKRIIHPFFFLLLSSVS